MRAGLDVCTSLWDANRGFAHTSPDMVIAGKMNRGPDRTGDNGIAAADYVISSSTAFLVFTFSSMLVVIQVASGQLTPRIIATTLLRDTAIRWSIALFVYSLLLAIGVKSRIDTVPHSLVSLMGILGLVSVVAFLFLIDHAARLLRPVSIVSRIARQGRKVIDDVYPRPIAAAPVPTPAAKKLRPADRIVSHRGSSSIVIAVNLPALVAEARRTDVIIELAPRVGDFVATDDPLFMLRGNGARNVRDNVLRENVAFGPERTIEQDSTFAFRVIVDIAIKALSPAINDPTTAVLAIDQLQRVLRTVGNRDLHDERILDSDGRLRVIFRTPNWGDFVHLACSEIRQCGTRSFQVMRRLRAMLESLLQNLPEPRLPALRQELDLLDRTVEKEYAFPEDLALARVPDSQGLGGSSGPRSRLMPGRTGTSLFLPLRPVPRSFPSCCRQANPQAGRRV
jgi:uncharacterized membrane protein